MIISGDLMFERQDLATALPVLQLAGVTFAPAHHCYHHDDNDDHDADENNNKDRDSERYNDVKDRIEPQTDPVDNKLTHVQSERVIVRGGLIDGVPIGEMSRLLQTLLLYLLNQFAVPAILDVIGGCIHSIVNKAVSSVSS